VARDRQRAKQRRRQRQPGSGGPTSGSRANARDETTPPAREPDDNSSPEPTEHAFPDVEEARMAEAGVPVDPPVDSAPDELEAGSAYSPDPAVEEERVAARAGRPKRGRVFTFLGHVVDELRRVQWPDRRHVGQGTAVVLGFVVLAGGYLGLMDAIWKPLVEAII
jgi:preprotein translocase subunit SecE